MIGYYGFRGAGKTRALVADIKKEFDKNPNLIVFTNTPFKFPKHKKTKTDLIQFTYIDFEEILAFFQFAIHNPDVVINTPSIVIMDEANLVMPSRFYDKLDGSVLAFLAESRKLNTDIFFTTQHPARVDKVLRELTEEWVMCRSIGSLLTVKLKIILDNAGQPLEQVGRKFLWKPSRFHGMYDTHHIVGISDKLSSNITMTSAVEEFIEKHYNLSSKEASKSALGLALSPKKNFFTPQNTTANVTTG